jgi:hypothetical protein
MFPLKQCSRPIPILANIISKLLLVNFMENFYKIPSSKVSIWQETTTATHCRYLSLPLDTIMNQVLPSEPSLELRLSANHEV